MAGSSWWPINEWYTLGARWQRITITNAELADTIANAELADTIPNAELADTIANAELADTIPKAGADTIADFVNQTAKGDIAVTVLSDNWHNTNFYANVAPTRTTNIVGNINIHGGKEAD
jgi:type III secretion system FlhB-like substrate exporter